MALNDREFMGYVTYVSAQYVEIHVPTIKKGLADSLDVHEKERARIGDYLMIEGNQTSFLGKIMEINTPNYEKIKFSGEDVNKSDIQLSIQAEILLGFDEDVEKQPTKGLMCYPCVGDEAFYSSRIVVEGFLKNFGLKYNKGYKHLDLGRTTDQNNMPVRVSMQSMFARHCAIVGTTGGGKSWTISKLIGEMKVEDGARVILIDPTGEYKSIEDESFMSVSIGRDSFFHYRYLTTEDLYFLIKPSGGIQMPKLLEAIRSLKAMELDETGELTTYIQNGLMRKANRKKDAFEKFYHNHISEIENGTLDFDIRHLSAQIIQECVFETDKNHPDKYGNRNEEAVSQCFNLISRTSNLLHTDVFKKAFGFNDSIHSSNEMTKVMDQFLSSDKRVLRIGFEGVGFEFQAREIIANAIGRYLLGKARDWEFREDPIVLFVDEAHQFLNKNVVDDFFQGTSLKAFDLIAKECRKYGLFLCIATQMPRDIPVGTLSQVGTFLVHRLINEGDKVAIREACSSASASILDFLPILGEGEAILSGVDFPMDITLKVNAPILRPNSQTPILGGKKNNDPWVNPDSF